jgi:Kef-type K+ transport system membrane component KefB
VSFSDLALIVAIGLLGPVLAWPRRWRLPVMLGELVGGVVFGPVLLGLVRPDDRTLSFLAQVGFALVMFVAGTHVPVRDPRLLPAARTGLLRAGVVGAVSVPVALLLAWAFGTGHPAMYAVVLASSSAALALPTVDSLGLTGPAVMALVPQVAVADAVSIVALQAAMQPARALPALGAALAVVGLAAAAYALLSVLERTGLRRRAHRVSRERRFALEMRVNLVVLFALAAAAVAVGASVLLAGFSFGLAVAAVGEPRRLARQLFALTDGFFAPVFFVWLGASLGLADAVRHPTYLLLGAVLGGAAIAVHLTGRLTGQPVALGGLAATQLGVPVAAVAIDTQLHVLAAGERVALIIGALVTVAAGIGFAARAARTTPGASGPARLADS